MLTSRIVPFLLALTPVAAVAQDVPDTARVAPVIVTATRTPLRADQVPASATIVTAAEIRTRGITHIADVLRMVPGVVVAQSGSYGAPTSLFVRGGQSNYTKVLIDGVPANEPGGAFDFGTLTVDDVERIEIVRGPSSVVWGSDAVSGVVHIITKQGSRRGGEAVVRGGTFGSVDASASYGAQGTAWRGAATAAHHESQGIHDFNSEFRNSLVSASGTWLAAATSLRLGGRYGSTRAHFPTDFTGAPVDPNAYRTEERASVHAEAIRSLGPASVRLTAGQALIHASSVDPDNAEPAGETRFDTRTLRRQLELRTDLPVATGVDVVLGGVAEWQDRGGASTTIDGGGFTRTENDHSRRNRGAFAEVLATSGATTATVGGRYDYSETYGDFVTYRVGASHTLPTSTRLRASVGTAFREPSFDEALPSAFSIGNPDIRPERSTSWEGGIEQHLAGGRVTVGATYFAQRFTDMIDYFSETFPGRYENVAAARVRGTELEARVQPVAPLSLDASMTFLSTRVATAGHGDLLAEGRSLLRRPARTASGGATWTARRFTAGVRAMHVGERQDMRFLYAAPYSQEETLAAYTKVDLFAEVPLLARGARALALTLRLDNVMDESYEPAAGYAAPGRAVMVGVRGNY